MQNNTNIRLYIGENLKIADSLPSTNEYIKEEIAKSTPFEAGTVILAKEQTKGRGQRNNSWNSRKNENLTFSYILYPTFLSPLSQFYLTVSVSLALVKFLKQYIPDVFIKWPNDIMAGNKKICGILIENTIRGNKIKHSIVGIGLNVNQTLFENSLKQATSIKAYLNSKQNFELLKLAKKLFGFLSEEYYTLQTKNPHDLLAAYNKHLFRKNEEKPYIIDNKSFNASIIAVKEDGLLRLKIGEHIYKYASKEVKYVF